MPSAQRTRQPYGSYKDSPALKRSNRTRPDGQPTFPLGFLDRPVPEVRGERRRMRFGLVAALLVCAAVLVIGERRS